MDSDYYSLDKSLMQLNLFIHLALPSASSNIIPIFWDHGFSKIGIAPKITVPAEDRMICQNNSIQVRNSANPDLMIENPEQSIVVAIECKTSGFGIGPSNERASKQARALLLACNCPTLPVQIGLAKPDSWETRLLYNIIRTDRNLMAETIDHLSDELCSVGLKVCSYGITSIIKCHDGLYLVPDSKALVLFSEFGWSNSNDNGICVMPLLPNEEPIIFPIIPWDPSIDKNPVGRKYLEERVRIALASTIGSNLPTEFVFSLDDILRKVTLVWDSWGDSNAKKSFRRYVHKYINKIVHQLRRIDLEIKEARTGQYDVKSTSSKVANAVRQYLQSSNYMRGHIQWHEAEQLELEGMSD